MSPSADGRYISYTSDSTDLIPGPGGEPLLFHLYQWDREAPPATANRLVSHALTGENQPGDHGTDIPSSSADGRRRLRQRRDGSHGSGDRRRLGQCLRLGSRQSLRHRHPPRLASALQRDVARRQPFPGAGDLGGWRARGLPELCDRPRHRRRRHSALERLPLGSPRAHFLRESSSVAARGGGADAGNGGLPSPRQP